MNHPVIDLEDQVFEIKRGYRTNEVRPNLLLKSIPSKKIKSNLTQNSESLNNPYESIQQIPSIQLTSLQMNSDPIALFMEMQEKYKEYGAVKVIASQGWNPPFTFRYIDKGITTRTQNLHTLKQGKAFLQNAHYLYVNFTQAFEQNIESYSIKNFEIMAKAFQKNYQMKTKPIGSNTQTQLQMQYWNLVSDPQCFLYYYSDQNNKKEVIVEYAADLPSTKYGSGFPTSKIHNWKDADFEYETNLFNLNNVFKSPLSLLAIAQKRKEKISGITAPWMYMGMRFSTFCWHVQDLWLNSLNYNHQGGIKTWYFIPQSDKQKFQAYIQKKYTTNSKKKNLLSRITLMEDPKQLIKNGIKIYKTFQNPRQYVCTFFKAYHCGFSQNFNIGEAVNFASPKSIPYMINCQLYNQKIGLKKPQVISIEWILYENIRKNQRYGPYSEIIRQAYNKMIVHQQNNIKSLLKRSPNGLKYVDILEEKVKYDKNYCCECKNYQYLSSVKCAQCLRNYCFDHYHDCCGGKYQFVFRTLNEDRMIIGQIVPQVLEQLKSHNTNISENYEASDNAQKI